MIDRGSMNMMRLLLVLVVLPVQVRQLQHLARIRAAPLEIPSGLTLSASPRNLALKPQAHCRSHRAHGPRRDHRRGHPEPPGGLGCPKDEPRRDATRQETCRRACPMASPPGE